MHSLIKTVAVIILAATGVRATTAHAMPVVLFDGTFSNADWTETITSTAPGASVIAQQLLSGGNPDRYRSVQHSYLTNIHVVHVNNNLIYDLGNGSIDSILFEFDLLDTGSMTYTMGFLQGGILYEAGKNPAMLSGIGGWSSFSLTLTAAEFFSQPAGLMNPDFSTSGAPLIFGFHTENTGSPGSPLTRTTGIDNLRITINRAIPEPSSAALFAVGLIALSLLGWRRNRAP